MTQPNLLIVNNSEAITEEINANSIYAGGSTPIMVF